MDSNAAPQEQQHSHSETATAEITTQKETPSDSHKELATDTKTDKYIRNEFQGMSQKEVWDNISGPQPRVTIYNPATGETINPSEETSTAIRKRFIQDEVIDMSFLQEITPVNVTPDGGIVKYLVQEGKDTHEDPPMERARAKIMFEGRLPNGELLDKERNRKEISAVRILNDAYIKGIHLAILSMKRGEIAWFKFAPEYHYGPSGVGEIPPNTNLFYRIELLDYKNPQKSLDAHDFEPRIKIFEECRIRGNELYNNGEYRAALKELSRAVNLLKAFPKSLKKSLTPEQTQTLHHYEVVINNNYAMNCIKAGETYDAQKHLAHVLQIDPNNVKALYRKGIVEMKIANFEEARKNFKKCLEINPNDAESKKMLWQVDQKRANSKRKEMKMFEKIFEKLPEAEKEENELKAIEEKINRKKRRIEDEERKTRMKEEEEEKQHDDNDDIDEDEDDFEYYRVDPSELEKGIILDNTKFLNSK